MDELPPPNDQLRRPAGRLARRAGYRGAEQTVLPGAVRLVRESGAPKRHFPKSEAKTLPSEEHVIRLVTRLLFVWFIKEKGSDCARTVQ